jgi:hypothetical protein
MPDARPLFLALALDAAPMGVVRLARFAWRRSAYVTSLVSEPDGTDDQWVVSMPAVQDPSAGSFPGRN